MINFGLPYMGSKSKIAAELIRVIPGGSRFVDVFAGGCAMTHAAMLAGRWNEFLLNDITDVPRLFKDAVEGKYRNETRWISRQEFFALKDKDPFVRVCFSFGNNGSGYLYGPDIEPYMKAGHYAVVFDEWTLLQQLCPESVYAARKALAGKITPPKRRLAFCAAIEVVAKRRNELQHLESLERLESLESLESLERLERLESPTIQVRRGDYRTLEILPGDVLYCDPPYKGTAQYNKTGFDHEAFYSWVEAQQVPVYISEYWMPEERFMCIWQKKTTSRLSQNGTDGAVVEKLFVKRPKKIAG